MKNYFYFILISFPLSAQVKGIVVDEFSKPISYVNIWVENQTEGATTEENGQFEINVTDKSKMLIFSSLGYTTQKVNVADVEKVILRSRIIELDEVVVSRPKLSKEIERGNLKKSFYLPESQQVPWIFAKRVTIDEDNKELKYLKSITYFTESKVKDGIFRVRIFSANEDGSPKEDLISSELIIKVKKGRNKTVIDVSSYGLEIPKEGILVGFESLLTEGNRYTQKALGFESKKTIIYQNYSPHILYNYIDTEESYAYRAGIWTKQLFKMFVEVGKKNRVLAPAIQITLTN